MSKNLSKTTSFIEKIRIIDENIILSRVKGEYLSRANLKMLRDKIGGTLTVAQIVGLLLAKYEYNMCVLEGQFRNKLTKKYEYGLLGLSIAKSDLGNIVSSAPRCDSIPSDSDDFFEDESVSESDSGSGEKK